MMVEHYAEACHIGAITARLSSSDVIHFGCYHYSFSITLTTLWILFSDSGNYYKYLCTTLTKQTLILILINPATKQHAFV